MSVEHPTPDDLAGMAWFNLLTERERAQWLDRAWKEAVPSEQYSLDAMPAAVDAWRCYKRSI